MYSATNFVGGQFDLVVLLFYLNLRQNHTACIFFDSHQHADVKATLISVCIIASARERSHLIVNKYTAHGMLSIIRTECS